MKAPAPVKVPERPKGAAPVKGNPKRLAILSGKLHTVGKGTITDGALMIEDGKITFAGARADLKLPEGTPVLTAAHATPGLIDAHTTMGLSGGLNIMADQDQDEKSDPNQADLRVLDGFNPNEGLLEFLRNQGVTVIQAVPGPSNVLAGQTGIFRTSGITAERMALRSPAGLLINPASNRSPPTRPRPRRPGWARPPSSDRHSPRRRPTRASGAAPRTGVPPRTRSTRRSPWRWPAKFPSPSPPTAPTTS
jgi:imidazolonepropionase-like amidohydrolase